MIKSAYIWGSNGPRTLPEVRTLADRLAEIGCTEVYVKAAGDQGVAWIAGVQLPSWAQAQWSPSWLLPYANRDIKTTPWAYPWPGDADQAAIIRALREVYADTFVLNPESEWRVQDQHSPYNTLARANAYARNWMLTLKQLCFDHLGKVPSFGLSSCPSWADFPYEGFAAECDFFLPEHYFFPEDMAHGEDMVAAHVRRAGTDKPCIPVVTACREYDDAGVLRLGHTALAQLPRPAGLACWEAGNTSFQAEAVRQVYALLPDETLEKQTVAMLALPHNTSDNPAAWHCSVTDKWVVEPTFLAFYLGLGDRALELLGLPVEGQVHDTQYFERARMELRADGTLALGRVGAELLGLDGDLADVERENDELHAQLNELRGRIDELLQTPKLPRKIAEALGDLRAPSGASTPAQDT